MEMTLFNDELKRCLGCPLKPCFKACPIGVSPHDFIKAAKDGDFKHAATLILAQNPLAQTCGLVCPGFFCKKACIRSKIDKAIEIPCLQAEIMQRGGYEALEFAQKNNHRIAIVGGGPAGLGALYILLRAGFEVDIYEKSNVLGGVARLIPEYRLPKEIFDFEIKRLVDNERTKVFFNQEITDFTALKEKYDGVILALGEPMFRKLGINGEEHFILYHEYLSKPEAFIGKKVAVCGGGEVALDCAMSAKKCGADEVHMFVRRRREDMRIDDSHQHELDREGIIINDLSSVVNAKKSSNGLCLDVVKNRIDENGKAQAIFNTQYQLDGYDIVIQALGAYFDKAKLPQGFIIAGDMTGACGTLVQALASGKAAAQQLMESF